MTEEERLAELLREALPTTGATDSQGDLWPQVVARSRARRGWSWLDLGIAAVIAALVIMRPAWLRLLAFHL